MTNSVSYAGSDRGSDRGSVNYSDRGSIRSDRGSIEGQSKNSSRRSSRSGYSIASETIKGRTQQKLLERGFSFRKYDLKCPFLENLESSALFTCQYSS